MKNQFHLDKTYFSNPLEYDDVYVSQIGRLFCKSDSLVKTHVHTDLFELTVATDGEGTLSTNGVPIRIKKGDIYLSVPGDIHRIEPDKIKPLKFDFFAFTLKDGPYREDMLRIAADYREPLSRLFSDEAIRPFIACAIEELSTENIYSKDILNALFRQVLIHIIRDFRNIKPKVNAANASRAEILCYNLMNYIDTHIYSMKNLEELSKATDYSYGYLCAIFKKTTSQTLTDYFFAKRFDAARLLLLEGKLTVTEISDLLNYSSVYAFSKAFRNYYGVSPRVYREEQKGEG